MAKHCNLCTQEYNLEDYDLQLKIPQIMEHNHLCFNCAFWTWRLDEDISLTLTHNIKDRFVQKYMEEKGLSIEDPDPMDLIDVGLPERKEEREDYIWRMINHWHFGKPLVLPDQTHLTYTPGQVSQPWDQKSWILSKDGMIVPYIMGIYNGAGITHQGRVPDHFMKSENAPAGFEVNALIINYKDICELNALGIHSPYLGIENKVPQEIINKFFNNLHK